LGYALEFIILENRKLASIHPFVNSHELAFCYTIQTVIIMESTLAPTTPRLIEYPADLSACRSLSFQGRNLLYLCSHEIGSSPFIVVLGYFSGQKEDVVTKDLIEPVAESGRRSASEAVSRQIADEYSGANILFL
jgi:hypothetical protein